jgi:4'-phosphopantetheinyl transferase
VHSGELFISEWPAAPGKLTLRKNEIHVWCCSLSQPPHIIESLTGTLADDEVKRAGRFHFQNGKLHFIVARGVLRTILARYLQSAPKDIRFRYGRSGKPALSGETESCICFNVSHSRNIVLFAFAYDSKIGVDVEHISSDRTFQGIAERFFSKREVSVLNSLPENEQRDAFFDFWTCKEAYLKAIGTGLSFGLDRVEIDITDGTDSVLASINGDADEAAAWTLQLLNVASGYAAALAIDGRGRDIKCWQWESDPA